VTAVFKRSEGSQNKEQGKSHTYRHFSAQAQLRFRRQIHASGYANRQLVKIAWNVVSSYPIAEYNTPCDYFTRCDGRVE
jgi:aspartyl/asparaginyl beta-hydroxylase (cupin superfamily)